MSAFATTASGDGVSRPVYRVGEGIVRSGTKAALVNAAIHSNVLKAVRTNWWLVDPRRSRRLWMWDLLTTLALVYTATVTPFEVRRGP